MLITRPAAQAEAFAGLCRARGYAGDIVISPLLRIDARKVGIPATGTLVFTSQSAARIAAARSLTRHRSAVAVGDRTAEVARAGGADCASAGGDVEALIAYLRAATTGPLVHLRGAHATGDLARRLTTDGREVTEIVIYDQVAQPLSPEADEVLGARFPVLLPLFSPRSARLARGATRSASAAPVPLALSAAVARAWGDDAMPVADAPTASAMAELVIRQARAIGRATGT